MSDKDLIMVLQDILQQYRQMTESLKQMLTDLSHRAEKSKAAEKRPAKTADHAPDKTSARKGGR